MLMDIMFGYVVVSSPMFSSGTKTYQMCILIPILIIFLLRTVSRENPPKMTLHERLPYPHVQVSHGVVLLPPESSFGADPARDSLFTSQTSTETIAAARAVLVAVRQNPECAFSVFRVEAMPLFIVLLFQKAPIAKCPLQRIVKTAQCLTSPPTLNYLNLTMHVFKI